MSLFTRVPGSAGECRVTARALDRLARRLEAAAAGTGVASHLSDDDFGGRAGAAFRVRTRDLSVLVDVQARRCRSLGHGLADLAEALAEAEGLMALARAESRHGLELDGWTLRRRAPVGADQAGAWARATSVAERARQIEAEAQVRWEEVLGRVGGSPPLLAPAAGADLAPPQGPTPGPTQGPTLGPTLGPPPTLGTARLGAGAGAVVR